MVAGGMSNHDDNKGIIIMGANCLIRMVNDSACRILGYAAKVGGAMEHTWRKYRHLLY
jgi:hypothetical protein